MKKHFLLLALSFGISNLFAQQQSVNVIQRQKKSSIEDAVKCTGKNSLAPALVVDSEFIKVNKEGMLEKRKSLPLACVFSALVPGLGQIYNGEVYKGVAFMVATYGVETSAVESMTKSPALGILNAAVALGIYVWNVIDAPCSSNRINKQKGIVGFHFKNTVLLVNPNIACLHTQDGQNIQQTTNTGFRLMYLFKQ